MLPVTVPSSFTSPQTSAWYRRSVVRSKNCFAKCVNAYSVFAMTIKPVVFLSKRCTKPGLPK